MGGNRDNIVNKREWEEEDEERNQKKKKKKRNNLSRATNRAS